MNQLSLIDQAWCAIDNANESCKDAINPERYENMVSNLTCRMLDTFKALAADPKADAKELIRHMVYRTLENDGYVQELTDTIRETMKELESAATYLTDEENERQVHAWWASLDALDQRRINA